MKMFKISDGDVIFVTHAEYRSSAARTIVQFLDEWINDRGLQDVNVVTVDSGQKDTPLSITVFTVNNVFENEVLNGGEG